MVEDGTAIGGAQLPREQHGAGVGTAPAQRGGDERDEPGDQRPDLLRRFGKGGRPALLQQCYGDACFAVGALGFALMVGGNGAAPVGGSGAGDTALRSRYSAVGSRYGFMRSPLKLARANAAFGIDGAARASARRLTRPG